jgi:hypothetical protein
MPGAEPKPPWRRVPAALRRQVEETLGSSVTRANRVWGGYSPSATFRLFLGDGRRVICKGVPATPNEVMRRAITVEERVYSELGSFLGRWAPAFFGSIHFEDWRVLLIEDVGPAQVPPWTRAHAEAALRDYAAFHASTLGRTGVPEWVRHDRHHRFAATWRRLADTPNGLEQAAGLAVGQEQQALTWLTAHLAVLRDTADSLQAIGPPHSVLHFDTRSDNLRIQPGGRLRLFDWPYTCLAPPELDMATFVQSITAEGGPRPEECVTWYAEVLPVRADAVRASAAAMAGYFITQAWQPPIPGLPRVRSIQRRQVRSSLAWTARLLDLLAPAWLSAIPD